MNVGYGMIAIILLEIGTNLVTLLTTSITSLVKFCKQKCRKKKILVESDPETASGRVI